MKKKLTALLAIGMVAGIGLLAGSAMATPVEGSTLQTTLDSRSGDGSFYDVNTAMQADTSDTSWEMLASQSTAAMILFEFAGFENTNSFGIYDLNDTSNRLTIFNGTNSASTTDNVHVDLASGHMFTNVNTSATATFSSDNFGFFLDVPGTTGSHYTYFSDTSENADGLDHMYAYEGDNNETFDFDNDGDFEVYNSDTWILAWEDLYGPYAGSGVSWTEDETSDRDFTDFVVSVTDVQPVPEPSTMLLFGAGLAGLAGVARRKKMNK